MSLYCIALFEFLMVDESPVLEDRNSGLSRIVYVNGAFAYPVLKIGNLKLRIAGILYYIYIFGLLLIL